MIPRSPTLCYTDRRGSDPVSSKIELSVAHVRATVPIISLKLDSNPFSLKFAFHTHPAIGIMVRPLTPSDRISVNFAFDFRPISACAVVEDMPFELWTSAFADVKFIAHRNTAVHAASVRPISHPGRSSLEPRRQPTRSQPFVGRWVFAGL